MRNTTLKHGYHADIVAAGTALANAVKDGTAYDEIADIAETSNGWTWFYRCDDEDLDGTESHPEPAVDLKAVTFMVVAEFTFGLLCRPLDEGSPAVRVWPELAPAHCADWYASDTQRNQRNDYPEEWRLEDVPAHRAVAVAQEMANRHGVRFVVMNDGGEYAPLAVCGPLVA